MVVTGLFDHIHIHLGAVGDVFVVHGDGAAALQLQRHAHVGVGGLARQRGRLVLHRLLEVEPWRWKTGLMCDLYLVTTTYLSGLTNVSHQRHKYVCVWRRQWTADLGSH